MQKLSLSLVMNKSRRGERGFSVSNGWERTEAIPNREKGEDSKSDVIFFHHDSCQNIIIRKLNKAWGATPTSPLRPAPCSPHGSPRILESTRIDDRSVSVLVVIEQPESSPESQSMFDSSILGFGENNPAPPATMDLGKAHGEISLPCMSCHLQSTLTVDQLVSPWPMDPNHVLSRSVVVQIEDEGDPMPPALWCSKASHTRPDRANGGLEGEVDWFANKTRLPPPPSYAKMARNGESKTATVAKLWSGGNCHKKFYTKKGLINHSIACSQTADNSDTWKGEQNSTSANNPGPQGNNTSAKAVPTKSAK
ncbi:hypothetical protein TNCV_4954841 [Trichonephila clavipes]|nr:hypothetical protein TNCV_4954841 [Trichonephila clavipes]